ncbi:Trp biosynthesis-associated membrane protein [Crossiella sp. CA198]|uniref:Trp biosynthesis-associated membrane protein n=1 Tax=Crossiella sp. CA198 TaxID=3455607 RepID=UPI003F8D8EC2
MSADPEPTGEPEAAPAPRRPGAGPLWTVVLLLAVTAGLLWGASGLAAGLAPAAGLAAFAVAAIAGVLAAGGWFRRVLGGIVAVVACGGAVLLWDGFSSHSVAGSALAVLGLLTLLGSGILVLVKGRRMPRMGGKYAASSQVRRSVDADRRLWDSLDSGADPTLRDTAETTNDLATQGGSADPMPEADRRRG